MLDEAGTPVEEGAVPTEPKAIVGVLRGKRRRYRHVGLEAGTISTWLHAELIRARLPAVLLETRQTHLALGARINKTDKNDARGIAELMRMGSFRPVHAKSLESRRLKSLLTVRKQLLAKQIDIEGCVGGLLMQHGLKITRDRSSRHYAQHVRDLLGRDQHLADLVNPLLVARATIEEQTDALTQKALAVAAEDPVCRRLMTAPCVGPLTALEYRAAIDDPARFSRSRSVAAHLGLTPRAFQSGDTDWNGKISRRGDIAARTALFVAARTLLFRMKRPSEIRAWGLRLLEKKGTNQATVAVARRLAVTLHSMWKTETDFRWNVSIN